MEHRLGPRARIPVSVVVRRAGRRPVRCRAGNIGPDGLFLALDPEAAGIRTGITLKLDLTLPGLPVHARAAGLVVHRGPDGVGVMFGSLDVVGRDLLDWFLARHWRHAAAA